MTHDPFAVEPRFAAKVSIGAPDECWEWKAARSSDGYGVYSLPRHGGSSKLVPAHRYGLGVALGTPIPHALEVDHLCRNRLCCNPAHLDPVTHAENMRRSPHQRKPGQDFPVAASLERSKTHCPQGHPYDETNTGVRPNGHRYCRACARIRMRSRRAISTS